MYAACVTVNAHVRTRVRSRARVRVHETIFGGRGNLSVSLYFVYVRSRRAAVFAVCLLLAQSESTSLSLEIMSLHQTYIDDPSCIEESLMNRLISSPELFAANSEAENSPDFLGPTPPSKGKCPGKSMIRGGVSRRQLFTSRPEKEELENDEDFANDVPQWEAEFRYAVFFWPK